MTVEETALDLDVLVGGSAIVGFSLLILFVVRKKTIMDAATTSTNGLPPVHVHENANSGQHKTQRSAPHRSLSVSVAVHARLSQYQ